MKKIYTLSSCDSCAKMLKAAKPTKDIAIVDIKTSGIDEKDLIFAAKQLGSYEALFSKKAVKYRALGLHEQTLTEKQMKALILKEYTFLLRPLTIIDDKVTIGKSNASLENLKQHIKESKTN
jgi:arsenate reductase (glutaredoxin)